MSGKTKEGGRVQEADEGLIIFIGLRGARGGGGGMLKGRCSGPLLKYS